MPKTMLHRGSQGRWSQRYNDDDGDDDEDNYDNDDGSEDEVQGDKQVFLWNIYSHKSQPFRRLCENSYRCNSLFFQLRQKILEAHANVKDLNLLEAKMNFKRCDVLILSLNIIIVWTLKCELL